MRHSDYQDYLDCRKKKVQFMADARSTRHDPVLRKLFVETALMYREHANQWLCMAKQ